MRVVIVYESLTGTTERAAGLIADQLAERGSAVTVCPITSIDYQALADADLLIAGSWTDGLVLFGQRPGRGGRFRRMPVVDGKRCVVYCTYAIDQGKTLLKFQQIMEERGATVLGGMAIHRRRLEDGVRDFVERVLDAVSA
jgi:hypothetical protein